MAKRKSKSHEVPSGIQEASPKAKMQYWVTGLSPMKISKDKSSSTRLMQSYSPMLESSIVPSILCD